MLSSVRRGLADVRDSVDPVIKILKYGVIRFETVTKTLSVPPRATCVAMVEDCDIYLLILGEEFDDPMPGTGLAPTEEESTVARSLGKPTVVLKKSGMNPSPSSAGRHDETDERPTSWSRTTWRVVPVGRDLWLLVDASPAPKMSLVGGRLATYCATNILRD